MAKIGGVAILLYPGLRLACTTTVHPTRRNCLGISRNALSLSSSTLLFRVGALLLLAYSRDQCLGLYTTFYLLLILVLYLHPALWRVIPMPMTSKPTSTA